MEIKERSKHKGLEVDCGVKKLKHILFSVNSQQTVIG